MQSSSADGDRAQEYAADKSLESSLEIVCCIAASGAQGVAVQSGALRAASSCLVVRLGCPPGQANTPFILLLDSSQLPACMHCNQLTHKRLISEIPNSTLQASETKSQPLVVFRSSCALSHSKLWPMCYFAGPP